MTAPALLVGIPLAVPAAAPGSDTLAYTMARLGASPDERFAAGFSALIAALDWAFKQEESAMDAHDLPMPEHRGQHRRVLASLHQCERRVAAGDLAAGRAMLPLLEQWFLMHQDAMDAPLAAAIELCTQPPGAPTRRGQVGHAAGLA